MSDGWEKFRVEGEDYYRAVIEIYHSDCANTCYRCSGSGEGMADGTTCMECSGWGELKHGGEGDRHYEVEWYADAPEKFDLWDGDPIECDLCGYDFTEDIVEELEAMRNAD